MAAAERLLERSTPKHVTMEQIARAAGVGKGTLYRRYPNLEAIAVALLDEHGARPDGPRKRTQRAVTHDESPRFAPRSA